MITSKKGNNKIIEKLTKKITPTKKIEDKEIKEVKRKLNTVETSKNEIEENKNEKDVDINEVLKQLSQYLTERDKKDRG